MTRRWFRPADAVVAALVVVLALACWIAPSRRADAVEVRLNGDVVATLSLSENGTYRYAGVTVQVEDGAAFVADADCPDRCCVRAGRLTKPGDVAICLPNRVSVTVIGSSDTDGVTY